MKIPTHPGEILKDELTELEMSAHALSMALSVPASRIDQIIKCKRSITPDTAIRLAAYFGGSPSFWLNMQVNYDLVVTENNHGEEIRREVKEHAA